MRKRLRSLLGLTAVSFVTLLGPATAGAADPDAAKITLTTSTTRLPNGLQVVLHEDHRTPIVAVNLWYHVGSKDEAEGRHGFAHLFEHVMFQGSKHVPEDTYFKDLERAGASDVNGSTAEDRTNYHETVPSNRLELALWLESDRMGFLLDHVDQATFSGQRDVVKNERRQNYENSPYGMMWQYIGEALFPPTHPYHHLAIGSPEDLDAATLEDVKQFFRTWYVPNNATLVIAGDIQPEVTLKLVEKYFGPIPSGNVPARLDQANPPKVELAGETRLDIEAGVELPRVVMAWVTPPYFAPGDADLDLVARVLTAGKTSRLYKRLVYDDQIAQDVSAFQSSGQLASKFEIIATAKPGHTGEELVDGIQQEIRRLQAGIVDDGELARARTSFLAREAFELEGVGERADRINSYVQYTGDAGFLPKDLARYEAVTTKSLGEAARRWLPLDKRLIAIARPVKGAPLCGRLVKRTP
ncbi:MAG TPA: pitrilysin family protein [Polyangiaceae bacterium]|jgi:predicted Zn-dependent peptidase